MTGLGWKADWRSQGDTLPWFTQRRAIRNGVGTGNAGIFRITSLAASSVRGAWDIVETR